MAQRGIIYLITNKKNDCKYVGETTLPMNKIWKHHIDQSKRMSSLPLHKAFRQFDVSSFNIKELDECNDYELEEKQKYWILHYNSHIHGYNTLEIETIEEEEDEESIEDDVIHVPELKEHYNTWYTIKDEDRGDGKKSGLKIQGKNIETGEIKTWDTVREAAEEITGNPRKNSNLLVCARNNYKCYGYKWTILEDKSKKKSIFGIHKKTERLGPRFESIATCIKELGAGGHGTGLTKSLKHPGRYSWRGFYWYYG